VGAFTQIGVVPCHVVALLDLLQARSSTLVGTASSHLFLEETLLVGDLVDMVAKAAIAMSLLVAVAVHHLFREVDNEGTTRVEIASTPPDGVGR
jgi:hypothetical protein